MTIFVCVQMGLTRQVQVRILTPKALYMNTCTVYYIYTHTQCRLCIIFTDQGEFWTTEQDYIFWRKP